MEEKPPGLTPEQKAMITPRILKLVKVFASRYARTYHRCRELESEGHMALVQAAMAWRPDGGSSFSTYAWNYVNVRVRTAAYGSSQVRMSHDRRWAMLSLDESVQGAKTRGDTLCVDRRDPAEESSQDEHYWHLQSLIEKEAGRDWAEEFVRVSVEGGHIKDTACRMGVAYHQARDRLKAIAKRVKQKIESNQR